MALTDKTIVITPRTGVGSPVSADPNIRFDAGAGSPDGAQRITLYARPVSSGTLSFEGTAGQLFSITNDLTGTIFSVNDISGIPSIEVDADGAIRLAEFGGTVNVGGPLPDGILWGSPATLTVSGDFKLTANNSTATFATFRMGANTLEIFGSPGNMLWIQTYGVDFITRKGGRYIAYEAANINFVELYHDGTDGVVAADGTSGLSFEADYHAFNGEIRAAASTTSQSSLNLPEGTAPSAPADGDMWVTTTDIFARINGVSESLLMASTATNATNVNVLNSTTSASRPLVFVAATGPGNKLLYTDNAVTCYINPSTNVIGAANFIGGGASVTNVDALTLNTRTESSVAGNNTIVLRTAAGYIFSNYINTTANVTASTATHLWVETGSDSYHRKQTPAQFITNHGIHLTATALAGDVTGAVGATVVGNDSHTHAFNNLTSKASGTGFYVTSGQIQAKNGLVGTYDDAASGAWGGPIWGMDDGYSGPTGGANALATSTYGMRWNRASSTQANANIGEGLYVYQNGVLEGGIGTAGVYSAAKMESVGNCETSATLLVNGTGGDYLAIRHNGTDAFIENLGTRYIDIELTTVVEARVRDSDVAGTTSGMQLKDHGQVLRDAGFNNLRRIVDNPASVAVLEQHIGGVIYADDNTAFAVALPSSTSSFPLGGMITIINANTSVAVTVTDLASYTCFYLDGATRTDIVGTCSIAAGGVANVWRSDTSGTTTPCYLIWGSGITP